MLRHKAPQIGEYSPLNAAAGFISVPCCLSLHLDTSLYSITQIIKEARILCVNGRQVFSFYVGSQLGLVALYLIGYACLLPPPLTGYQTMFLVWFILPILAFSLVFTQHGSEIMTHLPVKNTDFIRDAKRHSIYFLLRFCVIPVPVCIAVFWITITTLFNSTLDTRESPILKSWVHSPEEQAIISFAQNYVMLIFFVYMGTLD